MFKAISISKGIMAIGVVASLAVGGLGFAGGAEARINGDPASQNARDCKSFQDAYDSALEKYYAATTPEELIEARRLLNIASALWNDYGCGADYGSISAIVAGGGGTFSLTNAQVQGTLTTTDNNAGQVQGTLGTATPATKKVSRR